MALTLYPAQEKAKDALVEALLNHNSALDSSDTGTGKTLKAIEVSKTMGLSPFVICPKTVIAAWESALVGQGIAPTQVNVYNWEKLRTGNTKWVSRKGKKSFQWKLPTEDTLLIFDECHKAKGVRTLNANMLIAARKQGYKVLLLSATAAEDPREMRALGYTLGLHNLSNYWQWAQNWGCEFDRWNSLLFPERNRGMLKDLNKLIYPSRGHKLTREDLGDYFQRTRIITDPIRFGKKSKLNSLFTELEPEMAKLDARREGDGDEPIVLTKILRLRQEIELLKIRDIADMVVESREAGNAVAVFLNFTDSIDALSRRLEENHTFVQGGQSKSERDSAVKAFQDGTVGIILCNIAAGGVGVSLHDTTGKAPRIALISPTYNAKDFHQTLGRVDRIGGLSETVQRILVAEESIEAKIVRSMMTKIENLKLLHAKADVYNTEDMTTTTTNIAATVDEEEEHAEYSPSALKYHAACPGYKGESGTNPAAEMGTRIHEALETGDWSKLNDYESSLAQGCRNAEDAIFRHHGVDVASAVDYKEIRLTMNLLGESTFGTCDRLTVVGDMGVQIDYKTGQLAIDEPQENWQAKAYATGAFQRFPELETIHFYFIACRRDEILFHTFTREDVDEMVEDLSGIIKRAKKVHACFEEADVSQLIPQTKVCNYCSNAGRCPSLANLAVDAAKKYLPNEESFLTLPDEIHGSDCVDPDKMAEMLKVVPIVKKWAAGVEYAARKMAIEEGIEVPGYEVRERKGRRSITSALAAYGVIKDEVAVEDFLEGIEKFPVGKLEKLVSDMTPRGQKKERVSEVMAELYSLGVIEQGKDSQYLSEVK
jgi:superfamily II DNA or RNA helicase